MLLRLFVLFMVTVFCLQLPVAQAQNNSQRKLVGRYVYFCENDAKIVKDLFQNRKTGFHQIILGLPNGNTVALSQVQSSDGLTFSDDIQARWTMKGNNAVLELWTADRGWYTRFNECKYSTDRQTAEHSSRPSW